MTTQNRRRFLNSSLAALSGTAALASGRASAIETGDAPRRLDTLGPDQRSEINWEKPGQTPNSKFALNIEMWFGRLPFVERIAAAAQLGFPAVEFWPFQNKDLDAIAAATKDHGVAIAQFTAWGFSPKMNDPKNLDRFVEQIKTACQVAHQLDCKKMTVVGGDDIDGMTQAEMHANIITALLRIKPIVEDAGVMVILEPMNIRVDHKGHCLYGSPDAVRICREVDSPMVKINWDLYHMEITEGDLCRRLREGFDQVGYLQVADNPGRTEPGTGEINYARVLKEARELGYRGFIGLECRPSEDELTSARRLAMADVW